MAVYSTLLAIIEQRAHGQGFWAKGVTLWKAWWHDYAVKRAIVLRRTFWSRNWTLLGVPTADGRRLEVVVDGLPLHAGVQLAIDTTLVGALRGDGSARRGAADADGVALVVARRRKERRYPELVGHGARSRVVVLGVEVGGRWSAETSGFVGALARAKSRCAVPLMRKRAEWSWRLR